MSGTCHLFSATTLLPNGAEAIAEEFREQADSRLNEISGRLASLQEALDRAAGPGDLERLEEELKRVRVAYLRARRLSYCGSTREAEVDALLETIKRSLDELYRSAK
jgi:hypothetical protein